MSETAKPVPMTTYQFEIDDEKWDDWKDTVPRSKSLDQRIRELIEADTEGRVQEERQEPDRAERREGEPDHGADSAAPAPPTVEVDGDLRERLDDLDFPNPSKEAYTREDRVDLLATVYQRLEDANGDWVTRDELRDLFKTMPAGFGSENSWYENFIRNELMKLPEVEKRGPGASGMRITKAD